jgi:hypothetical protein
MVTRSLASQQNWDQTQERELLSERPPQIISMERLNPKFASSCETYFRGTIKNSMAFCIVGL